MKLSISQLKKKIASGNDIVRRHKMAFKKEIEQLSEVDKLKLELGNLKSHKLAVEYDLKNFIGNKIIQNKLNILKQQITWLENKIKLLEVPSQWK